MNKVLVIGAAMVDVMMNVDELPSSGQDIIATENIEIGGCALNVAHVLQSFDTGFDLLAPIGKGRNADLIYNHLEEHHMHRHCIKDETEDNGYCLSLIEKNGERTFITVLGVEVNFKPEWFSKINAQEYNMVYVSGYEIESSGGNNIIDFLVANPHLQIFFAPSPRITYIDVEKMDRMLNLSPIVHLNEAEVLAFTKQSDIFEAITTLYDKTQASIIVTRGSKSTIAYENNKFILVDAQKDVKVINTSGAGDSHIGGIITALQKGSKLNQAIKFANQVSAQVVQSQRPTFERKGDFEYDYNN
ncbi:MAG: hypothetical protein BEN19_01365 [Epulopiscium sp. Nuni2H_MBin003]|nr:MAG: hypothetical protein BEN19_01365 [Epulopiscium sp. Nuni2H_MBin003]